jgi:alpha-1,2-mannosyltransferase
MAMDPASGLAWPSDRHALRGGSVPVGAVPPHAGSTVRTPAGVSRWGWGLFVPAVIALLAFACRLVPVLRGGGLFGVDTYDPSVYYSAAVGLFSGRMPYRDFLLLHPPGILLALQPFAALGAAVGDPIAMASARFAFMLLGAASSLLIYRILLRHHRLAAALGAGA